MLSTPRTFLLATSTACALLACESSVSSFDPAAATEAAGTVVTALQQSPAFQTMSVLGDDITVGAPPAPLIWAALPNEAFAQGRLTDWARLGAETLASHADLLAPIFPSDLLGKTFTYNLSQSRYEVSTQPGAPATGVRFVLYAVNIVAHTVQQPLNPVGYLDLTDLSDPSAAVLGVKIVINNATLLDYQASATFSTGSIAFGADGSISDGQTTVEFDLTQSVTSGPTIAVDYRLAVPEEQVELELVATITAAQSDINLTIAYQGTTTIVHAEGNPNGIVGMITHNDALVVNIAGTPDNPVFTDPSGAELSPAQIEALQNLFDSTDALLDAFDELLGPAHRLLGIPL